MGGPASQTRRLADPEAAAPISSGPQAKLHNECCTEPGGRSRKKPNILDFPYKHLRRRFTSLSLPPKNQ